MDSVDVYLDENVYEHVDVPTDKTFEPADNRIIRLWFGLYFSKKTSCV